MRLNRYGNLLEWERLHSFLCLVVSIFITSDLISHSYFKWSFSRMFSGAITAGNDDNAAAAARRFTLKNLKLFTNVLKCLFTHLKVSLYSESVQKELSPISTPKDDKKSKRFRNFCAPKSRRRKICNIKTQKSSWAIRRNFCKESWKTSFLALPSFVAVNSSTHDWVLTAKNIYP